MASALAIEETGNSNAGERKKPMGWNEQKS